MSSGFRTDILAVRGVENLVCAHCEVELELHQPWRRCGAKILHPGRCFIAYLFFQSSWRAALDALLFAVQLSRREHQLYQTLLAARAREKERAAERERLATIAAAEAEEKRPARDPATPDKPLPILVRGQLEFRLSQRKEK